MCCLGPGLRLAMVATDRATADKSDGVVRPLGNAGLGTYRLEPLAIRAAIPDGTAGKMRQQGHVDDALLRLVCLLARQAAAEFGHAQSDPLNEGGLV
jgi:hypothetical protein